MRVSDVSLLPRSAKRTIFLAVDTALVPVSLYLATALRFGSIWPAEQLSAIWVLFPLSFVAGAAVIWGIRLHQIKLNALEHRAIARIIAAAAALAMLIMVVSYLLRLPVPRTVPMIFGAVFFLGALGMRIAGLLVLGHFEERESPRIPVAIYGAGAAGIQLASALLRAREARPVFFIDDNPNLHGLMVAGLPVCGPGRLPGLIARHSIARVLLAIPSLSDDRRNDLTKRLLALSVEVRVLPSYIDMMSGNANGEIYKAVAPDALLGRDKVVLDTPEIEAAYAGRVVMVTGAGGSIGSELCRQLLNCNPARLVLFDHGEYQLYAIDRDLNHAAGEKDVPVIARLGSVTDRDRVASVIADERVDIILHAAAYKHVPMVEDNQIEGVRNNVLGTQTVAECADAAGIERFILVSTDKAVRPTNIMGASKRMSELVVQDIATRAGKTLFSMVRFGNVLGSSGSVLPLFQRQIEEGGPVTVTHPEITRFFMTIPEAARLVLLAGAYAEGGDVFVLDMGKPQKILDIARQMITLSGHTVKNMETGEGDIAIKFTGLRPGEKIFEELLIDGDNLVKTPHPKIMRAEEHMLSQIEVASMIRELQSAIGARDRNRLKQIVRQRVDGYHIQEDVPILADRQTGTP